LSIKAKQTIAILTATRNAARHVCNLANSLREQTDQNFSWIVIDGRSEDDTVKLLEQMELPQLDIHVVEDFGIYDALNKAILISPADYYVVAGSDDLFHPKAVEIFKSSVEHEAADIYAFHVLKDGVAVAPRNRPLWWSGHKSIIAEHAVGSLIKRDLHRVFGLYSNRYPIAADHDFVIKVFLGGAKHKKIPIVAGVYGTGGLSATDSIGALLESFRIQLGWDSKLRQYLLLVIRLGLKLFSGAIKSDA